MAHKKSRQAKLQRKARKADKRARRAAGRHRELPLSLPLHSGLYEAGELLKSGKLDEAVEILEELRRRYPRRREVLDALIESYYRQQDMWSYQATCQRILELDPADEDVWLALAGVALSNGQMAAAHHAFSHFLSHWPDSPLAEEAADTHHELDDFLRSEVAKMGLPEDEGIDLLLMHDKINFHLHQGENDQLCAVAGQLLDLCPTFAPALNNQSQAHFRSGRIDLAIADARRVLEFDPGNFHALANLARYLLLDGQFEEAEATAERMKVAESDSPDLYVKHAETLIFLGDWEGVLEALERAVARADADRGADDGMLYHLAGVAAAELGRLDVARKHWKRAAKLDSVAPWAQQNLADLSLPPGEQNGAWAFPIDYWIPLAVFDRLIDDVERSGPRAKDGTVCRNVRKFFQQHPYLERLMPRLLEHGDPAAKEFVVRIASLAELPSIFSALRDFAFGRRGSDELRLRAATSLLDAGVLSPGEHRLWVEGEPRDLVLMTYDISPEPFDPLPDDVMPLALKAHEALNDEDGATAESLYDEALRQYPDHPTLVYNRTVAVGLQGRMDEAMSLVQELHARHPDYLFARVQLAEEAVKRREFEAARNLLGPLMTRSRFHLSEYAGLCHAHITLLMAEGRRDGARSWLKAWQEVDPDDPRTEYWAERLSKQGLFGSMFRRG